MNDYYLLSTVKSFLMFCIYFKLCYLPVSTETLQLYAQFLSRSFVAVDSIRNYISGVKTLHMLLGHGVDHINSYLVNLSLKGISRKNPRSVKRAQPMTLDILERIFDILDFSDHDNLSFYCLFLFAFYLVARKSNLVPDNKADLDSGKFLSIKSIKYFDNYILVHFNWSKTIQFGEREIISPLLRVNNLKICPVFAFERYIAVRKSKLDTLFCLKDGSVITYYLFQKKLKDCIRGIGMCPDLFTTHSFRRGFTTMAFRKNISPEHIKLIGDWKSDAFRLYCELDWTDKLKILEHMFNG